MTFVFRVDSSSEIGHGHLVRCLALAKALKSYNKPIHFICRENSGSAHGLVLNAGFELHLLPGKRITFKSLDHRDWLGCSQIEDAQSCNKIMAGLPECHLIVDHYGLDMEWESRVLCKSLTVIDDLADRPHKCCRVIDQSLVNFREDYRGLIAGDFEFWGGGNILLREEFILAPGWQASSDGSLMICMGGADPDGVTVRVVKALASWLERSPERNLLKKIVVVVGKAFDFMEDLEKCLASFPIPNYLYKGHPEVSSLMESSSAAVLSCGTMILEACALGVPSIGIPIVKNQENTATFLSRYNAIFRVDIGAAMNENLAACIEIVLGQQDARLTLSQRSKEIVNKNAVSMIAESIINGC